MTIQKLNKCAKNLKFCIKKEKKLFIHMTYHTIFTVILLDTSNQSHQNKAGCLKLKDFLSLRN